MNRGGEGKGAGNLKPNHKLLSKTAKAAKANKVLGGGGGDSKVILKGLFVGVARIPKRH